MTFKEIGVFEYRQHQLDKFKSGELWNQWGEHYPQLFEPQDVEISKNQAHKGYHFFEWMTAILLWHTMGYLSFVEQYEFIKHREKRMLDSSLKCNRDYLRIPQES